MAKKVKQHDNPTIQAKRESLHRNILQGVAWVDSLTALDLSNLQLDYEGLDRLLKALESRQNLQLQTLHLNFNNLNEMKSIRRLAESPCVMSLIELELGGNDLGDAGTQALVHGHAFNSLKTLNLQSNSIGNLGAKEIANSDKLPALEELNLRRNEIYENGILAICSSALTQRLRKLNVDENPFGNEGFKMLKKSFDPKKTFIW